MFKTGLSHVQGRLNLPFRLVTVKYLRQRDENRNQIFDAAGTYITINTSPFLSLILMGLHRNSLLFFFYIMDPSHLPSP